MKFEFALKTGGNIMMYPYMTLDDDTEIAHSEMLPDGRVKVYIETPDLKDGFHNATCYLPDYTWEEIYGYSEAEMNYFKEFVRNNAHLIIELSQDGNSNRFNTSSKTKEIENNCKLCGSKYDFRMVKIGELFGEITISLSGSLRDVDSSNRFNFCPLCGRKLMKENYGGKEI